MCKIKRKSNKCGKPFTNQFYKLLKILVINLFKCTRTKCFSFFGSSLYICIPSFFLRNKKEIYWLAYFLICTQYKDLCVNVNEKYFSSQIDWKLLLYALILNMFNLILWIFVINFHVGGCCYLTIKYSYSNHVQIFIKTSKILLIIPLCEYTSILNKNSKIYVKHVHFHDNLIINILFLYHLYLGIDACFWFACIVGTSLILFWKLN